MKKLLPIFFFAVLFLTLGAQKVEPPMPPKQPQMDPGQLRMIEQLLKMDNEELARIRMTIERIEQMEPQQKERLLTRIQGFQDVDNERRIIVRREMRQMSPDDRDILRAWLSRMTPEERQQNTQKLDDLTAQERIALRMQWVQEAKEAGITPDDAPPLLDRRVIRRQRMNEETP